MYRHPSNLGRIGTGCGSPVLSLPAKVILAIWLAIGVLKTLSGPPTTQQPACIKVLLKLWPEMYRHPSNLGEDRYGMRFPLAVIAGKGHSSHPACFKCVVNTVRTSHYSTASMYQSIAQVMARNVPPPLQFGGGSVRDAVPPRSPGQRKS